MRKLERCGRVLHLVALLVPAFYCSWIALRVSRRLEHEDDGNLVHQGVPSMLVPVVAAATESPKLCFSINSNEWLDQPRHGNSNETSPIRDEWQRLDSLQGPWSLGQTICDPQSPLLNFVDANEARDKEQSIRLWTTRLIYWVVHDHQHRPAYPEAKLRRNNECAQMVHDKGIGSFDFECPTAKFLVVSYDKSGIGANVRLGAVPALEAGLASGRVVVWVDDATDGPSFLREPWPLASCQPRRDAQCFFRPETPCVVTHRQLQTAHVLTRGEARHLFRYGRVPTHHSHDRVLIVHLSYRPQRQPEALANILHEKSLELMDQWMSSHDSAVDPQLLHQAAEAILDESTHNGTFNYYGAGSTIFRSLLLYALRPNWKATSDMEAILHQVLSSANDVAPHSTLGLPIRASDKCGSESECLLFEQYISAARELWASRYSDENVSVIVTTESQSVLADQANFAKSLRDHDFPARFVTNRFDVLQDTGYMKDIKDGASFTADDAMLSAVSSLKLQLLTGVTLGNCCSNFHLVLKDLLSAGCGSSPNNVFQCLQEHENPAYRVCCAWDKSPECRAKMNVSRATDSTRQQIEIDTV